MMGMEKRNRTVKECVDVIKRNSTFIAVRPVKHFPSYLSLFTKSHPHLIHFLFYFALTQKSSRREKESVTLNCVVLVSSWRILCVGGLVGSRGN